MDAIYAAKLAAALLVAGIATSYAILVLWHEKPRRATAVDYLVVVLLAGLALQSTTLFYPQTTVLYSLSALLLLHAVSAAKRVFHSLVVSTASTLLAILALLPDKGLTVYPHNESLLVLLAGTLSPLLAALSFFASIALLAGPARWERLVLGAQGLLGLALVLGVGYWSLFSTSTLSLWLGVLPQTAGLSLLALSLITLRGIVGENPLARLYASLLILLPASTLYLSFTSLNLSPLYKCTNHPLNVLAAITVLLASIIVLAMDQWKKNGERKSLRFAPRTLAFSAVALMLAAVYPILRLSIPVVGETAAILLPISSIILPSLSTPLGRRTLYTMVSIIVLASAAIHVFLPCTPCSYSERYRILSVSLSGEENTTVPTSIAHSFFILYGSVLGHKEFLKLLVYNASSEEAAKRLETIKEVRSLLSNYVNLDKQVNVTDIMLPLEAPLLRLELIDTMGNTVRVTVSPRSLTSCHPFVKPINSIYTLVAAKTVKPQYVRDTSPSYRDIYQLYLWLIARTNTSTTAALVVYFAEVASLCTTGSLGKTFAYMFSVIPRNEPPVAELWLESLVDHHFYLQLVFSAGLPILYSIGVAMYRREQVRG